MILIFEITAGVFLGVCFLHAVLGELPDWLRFHSEERRYKKAIARVDYPNHWGWRAGKPVRRLHQRS